MSALATTPVGAPAVSLGLAAGLEWVWRERSQHPGDANMGAHGAVVHQLVGHSPATGAEVASMRIEWFPADALAEAFPDVWHFQARCGGWHFDPSSLESTWRAACTHRAVRAPLDGCPLTEQHMRAELDRAATELQLQRQLDMRAAWGSYPFPAYAKVEAVEAFAPRQGIGTAMYLLAAQTLGGRGQLLRASTLQSDDAEALWAKLAAGPWPTRQIDLPPAAPGAEAHRVLCLDYTAGPIR